VGTLAYWNEQQRLTEQKAHEERLLAEEREHALEKALMAAMIGDFDGGEKAIGEAELLGASTGQVRMLRGYLAFHRGDMEQAIQHLEQAAKLLPPGESGAGAARAMLGLAYYQSPQGSRFEHVFQELETLSPRSLEDYLFKGQVEAIIHPERGLKTLDEAVRRRDSSIIRALRTEARANHALFTGEVRTAELALEDSRVAKAMLPGNPLVLARSVYAHLVAAGIYENADRGADREHVLAQARADVEVLERFHSSPIAARACFEYFDFVGDEEAAYAMSQRGTEFRHVVMLYRRGELAKALEAADRSLKVGGSFNGSFARVERAFVLADLADGPAQARVAFREATALAERCTYQQLGPPLICLLLGRRDEAVQAFLQVREDQRKIPPWLDGWYYKYLDYHCGLMTTDELLQAAGTSPTKLCEAHSLIGLHHLAGGDRVGASEHFRKCAATRAFNYWHYVWSRAFLKRLEDDPAWPPWIPLKK
jgi:tetratricopeptide (TPR) repeat protein